MDSNPLTEMEISALRLSLMAALTSALCGLPLALCAVLIQSKCRPIVRFVFDIFIHIPMALPPLVIGYLLLIVFSPNSPIGYALESFAGITVLFTWTGVVLASLVMSLPFQIRLIRAGLDTIPEPMLQTAATLGAGPWDRTRTVLLPLLGPHLVAAIITAFTVSLGQFGAVIVIAANLPGVSQTLPLALFTALQTPGAELEAARLAGLSIVLATIGLATSTAVTRWALRRIGQGT